MMGLFEFITSRFGSMPKTIQVVTYIIFVFLVVYLYLSPRIIVGQIVATTENGGFVPYRGTQIQTHVQGHMLKFRTNESGFWTIPVVNRLPDDVTIQVFHEDDRSWVPITLRGWDVWTQTFRIEILSEKPLFKLHLAQAPTRNADRTAVAQKSIFGTAHAGALIDKSTYDRRYRKPRPAAPSPTATRAGRTAASAGIRPPKLTKITKKVSRATARILRRKPATVTKGFRLTRRNGVSYVQRIQIVEGLEKDFKLKIPDEHWRRLTTIDEIARYISQRKKLVKSFPQIRKYEQRNNWPLVQQSIPAAKRPVFIDRR